MLPVLHLHEQVMRLQRSSADIDMTKPNINSSLDAGTEQEYSVANLEKSWPWSRRTADQVLALPRPVCLSVAATLALVDGHDEPLTQADPSKVLGGPCTLSSGTQRKQSTDPEVVFLRSKIPAPQPPHDGGMQSGTPAHTIVHARCCCETDGRLPEGRANVMTPTCPASNLHPAERRKAPSKVANGLQRRERD